jgi:hypothetical protein
LVTIEGHVTRSLRIMGPSLVTTEGHATCSPHPSDRAYQWSGSGEQRRLCKRTLGFHRNPTRLPPLRPLPRHSSPMASLSEDLPRPAACHTTHRSPPRARRAAASASSPTSRPTREPRPHHSRSAALSHGQNQARARVQGTLSTVRIFSR